MTNWRNLTLSTYPTYKYVDLSGSIGGSGLPTDPYGTVQQGLDAGGNVILGTGTYTGAFSSATAGRNILGEIGLKNQTIINLNGATAVYTDGSKTMQNLTLKNGTILLSSGNGGNTTNFTNVRFIDMTFTSTAVAPFDFVNCEFINCAFSNSSNFYSNLTLCKVFGTAVVKASQVTSCDFDETSSLTVDGDLVARLVKNCNIRCDISTPAGTNPNVFKDLATALVENPSIFGTGNFDANPLYNDVSKLALTVASNSPNIATGFGGTNIGGVKIGTLYLCGISPELIDSGNGGTATVTDLDGSFDLTVSATASTGNIQTGALDINSSFPDEVGFVNYVGNLALDSNLGGGANAQVPDANDYVDGTDGNRPERIAYYGRWCEFKATPPNPNINADWDNGGLHPAGTWILFEWNQQPKLDALKRGNGDALHNDSSASVIGAKWFQMIPTLIKSTWNDV